MVKFLNYGHNSLIIFVYYKQLLLSIKNDKVLNNNWHLCKDFSESLSMSGLVAGAQILFHSTNH